ncbi:DMT family transporter [Alteromonas lipotrueiana]|uniref:DMT family transporter n=1 Tax=Alteromonas lipotrueiana TaxID=2803815 RepID=UPI001C440356|nr:multidrug efflux SMR transporter [Alteromonas lipotrueiana]
MAYGFLAIAICAEVLGTLALKASAGFTHSLASTLCVISYGIAFYFLALVVKTLPVGTTYAIWSGAGIVLITALGALWYKEIPDLPALIGMTFILLGVLIINVFSQTALH